jgi:hypothetical protein
MPALTMRVADPSPTNTAEGKSSAKIRKLGCFFVFRFVCAIGVQGPLCAALRLDHDRLRTRVNTEILFFSSMSEKVSHSMFGSNLSLNLKSPRPTAQASGAS